MHALLGAFASVLLVAAAVSAGDDKAPPSSNRWTTECTAQAGDKHLAGDARKQFIAECVKARTAMQDDTSTPPKDSSSKGPADGEHHTPQTERMKACSHEASSKNLHGDERKTFMSHCLKGDKKS